MHPKRAYTNKATADFAQKASLLFRSELRQLLAGFRHLSDKPSKLLFFTLAICLLHPVKVIEDNRWCYQTKTSSITFTLILRPFSEKQLGQVHRDIVHPGQW